MKQIPILLMVIVIALSAGTAFAQDDDMPTVGIVSFREMYSVTIDSFIDGMTDLGYVEDEDIVYIRAETIEDDSEVQRESIQDVIDAGVDVILAVDEREAVVVRELTDSIPIVFGTSNDPIGAGLVDDLTEPGGNATGVVAMTGVSGRRLQLLVEIDPTIERVYIPRTPENLGAETQLAEMEAVAESLEIELVVEDIADLPTLIQTITTLEGIDAIFLMSGDRLSQTASLHWFGASMRLQAGLSIELFGRVPGVLMGYGPSTLANAQLAAAMVDQILRGADPAEMPVQNAETGLMINLEIAQGLGIDVPRGVLRQAELIIRSGDMDDTQDTTETEEEETPEPDAESATDDD